MNKLFDVEGPLIIVLTKIADIIILNLLVIICSLPVFTIGASYTALYYVTLKMVKNEEAYTVRSFFKSFKMNFKQATVIWVVFLFAGVLMFFDLKIISGDMANTIALSKDMGMIMLVVLMSVGLIFSFALLYVFPVLSRFDNTVKNTIKNALIMSIKHFPYTVAIVIITIAPLVFIYLIPQALILVFVVFGLSAYFNSFFFVKIFEKYMPKSIITDDDSFEAVIDADNNK